MCKNETIDCNNKAHNRVSPYPKNATPKCLFLKDPDNHDSKILRNCKHCRDYDTNRRHKRKDKKNTKKKELETDPNFRVCTYDSHNVASLFPFDKVPISKFVKDENNLDKGYFERCSDCRNHLTNSRNNNIAKAQFSSEDDPNFSSCNSAEHMRLSKYPQNKVPIRKFLKDPDDPNSEHFKSCNKCREYKCSIANNNHSNRKEKNIESVSSFENGETDFLFCPSRCHIGVSKYPRDKVPFFMFQRYEDSFDDWYDTCADCRIYKSETNIIYEKIKKESAKPGEFYCRECNTYHKNEEKAKKKDGTINDNLCELGKIKVKIRTQKIRQSFHDLLYEYFLKNEASCQKCKSIFLIPDEGTKFARKIKTYNVDGIVYVDYEGKQYLARDFLLQFKEILEFRVIEMDHLTEEEQRQRDMLAPFQEYEGKLHNVSELSCKRTMRIEARKCQNLCCECHVETTIEREDKLRKFSTIRTTKLTKEKKEYVDNFKRELGCSVCGLKTLMTRFLEMDHLDPKIKLDNISAMVYDPLYSLEDVKRECEKCRVLCRHCHKIHTSEQRKEGII